MPLIKVNYDDAVLSDAEAESLCRASVRIVKGVTGIEETFAYGHAARINIDVPPVEVLVEMSAHKIEDGDTLVKTIRRELEEWKREQAFPHKINLGLIPMNWKMEFDV
jgi:hypothetical protein